MKTIEELRGMKQEELVILAQELQESLKNETDSKKIYSDSFFKKSKQYDALKNLIKSVIVVID